MAPAMPFRCGAGQQAAEPGAAAHRGAAAVRVAAAEVPHGQSRAHTWLASGSVARRRDAAQRGVAAAVGLPAALIVRKSCTLDAVGSAYPPFRQNFLPGNSERTAT